MRTVLAIDLGASSGRGILYSLRDGKLVDREVHRFYNGAKEIGGGLYWDIEYLFGEIVTALKKGAELAHIDGVGIDTWGVDYGYMSDGKITRPVRNYRDARTSGAIEKCDIMTAKDLYFIAGIAPNEINTSYQLYAERKTRGKLQNGEKLLMIPQLLGAMLTGVAATEPTIASTTGFFGENGFDSDFLKGVGLCDDVFPPVYETGSVLGNVKKEISEKIGVFYDIPVILCPGHDTACAVLSIPSADSEPLFLSSGTWSLFGAEIKKRIITEKSYFAGYSNEIGYGNSVRFLKNIMGLWILQECRKQWIEEGQELSFAEITELAAAAPSCGFYIDVDNDLFRRPDRMADKVEKFVSDTQGKRLKGIGEIARCVFESLTLEYLRSYRELCAVTGRNFSVLHIIGGGSQNELLNQMTANALKITVSAGPAEGTATGNAAAQLITLGEIADKCKARKIIAESYPPKIYYPQESGEVSEENYKKYLEFKNPRLKR